MSSFSLHVFQLERDFICLERIHSTLFWNGTLNHFVRIDHELICNHLDESVVDTDIELDGFQPPVRLDRNRHGGGVMFYVKNNLSFKKRDDIYIYSKH